MTLLLPGTPVRARGLDWEVVSVDPAGEQQLFRLRCTEGALRGFEFELLSPFEPIEPIRRDLDPARAGRIREWRLYHEAFLLEQALGPRALVAVEPGRLDIAPYQIVPVMRALELRRPRLLLADGVGLGKTVEAGMVLAELIARRRAHRILVVSPAGPLLEQWNTEMRTRFGLRFRKFQRWGNVQEILYTQELGANPFDHEALCLASIDFAKQEKVLQYLERTSFDVVVIDEAHHVTSLGTAADRDDSLRRRLAEVLARQSDGLLLLTATPHDGYDPHFASIIELLDPSLVDGRGALRGERYKRHVIRRLKDHIKDRDGNPLFKKREVHAVPVRLDRAAAPQFAAFQHALLALVAPRLKRALRQKHYGDVLAFVALLKRSVSTAAACRGTLEVVRDRFTALKSTGADAQDARRQRLRTLRDYRRRLERYGALSWEEEQDQVELEAEEIAADLIEEGAEELIEQLGETQRAVRRERDRLKKVEETLRGLDELVSLATAAVHEDPKLPALLAAISQIRNAEPSANILVYTEYVDSQDEVVRYLNEARKRGELDGEVITISGKDDERTRIALTSRFASEDGLVLVSTDATAEGLNLHERCHHLIHLELPYNPNRLEQRNGRIDRYGQKRIPYVSYLYLEGTFEERLLLRLVAKYERQRARLTFVPNTLGILSSPDSPMTGKLLEGLSQEQGELFKRAERAISFAAEAPEDTDTEEYRELLSEIQRATSGFEKASKTYAWLGTDGLGAEPARAAEAEQARDLGRRQGDVRLFDFVKDAVTVDRGHVADGGDGIVELRLSGSWTYGLDGLPGWDAEHQTLRLTVRPEVLQDPNGNEVGLAGRAHPIVRRAIDRVRNQQFGADATLLDRRVSAVEWSGEQPELLVTLLGEVQSAEGREYERLIAVRVARDGASVVYPDHGEWRPLADGRGIPTKGLWDRLYADWGDTWRDPAIRDATAAFGPLAEDFQKHHLAELAQERAELASWIRVRAEQLCGEVVRVQQDFLRDSGSEFPAWKTEDDPLVRLSQFARDRSTTPARRREAEGVLELHQVRLAAIARREDLRIVGPSPLGLLMLVPAGAAR